MGYWSGVHFSSKLDFQFSTIFCLRLRFTVLDLKLFTGYQKLMRDSIDATVRKLQCSI